MRRWLTAVGAVGLAALAPAADPVADLARGLGAPAYADREAATRALAALGPAAIPALEEAARSPNPEVARRAFPLLAHARLTADSAARLRPRPVRIGYRAVPLWAAVADLRERTGIDLRLDPAGVADVLRPVTCETADLPPWEAVAAFARAAGLREVVAPEIEIPAPAATRNRSYYTPPPLTGAAEVPVRFADGSHEGPGVRGGAVRVVVLPPTFPGGKVDGQRTLYLDVTPLPGVKWEGVTDVQLTRVVDDTGRPGGRGHDAPPPPPPAYMVEVVPLAGGPPPVAPAEPVEIQPPTARPNPRVVAVPVRPGSAGARVLTVLEGEVLGEVAAADQEVAALTGVAAGRSAAGPGGRLGVIEVIPHPAGVRVTVQVEVPSPWTRLRRRQPDGPIWPDVAAPVGAGYVVRAFDAAGHELPAAARPAPGVSDDGAVKTLTWALSYPAAPARLEATGPRVVPVAIPFRLANVPLP
ncbi:MAG TPA: hypothetical protein VH092_37345 [Urbifossiella sp.]|jgi:hypothetical protein|nr:hypothetical protein [Urbifossiella sp.]